MIVPNLAPGGLSPNRVTSESTSTDFPESGGFSSTPKRVEKEAKGGDVC